MGRVTITKKCTNYETNFSCSTNKKYETFIHRCIELCKEKRKSTSWIEKSFFFSFEDVSSHNGNFHYALLSAHTVHLVALCITLRTSIFKSSSIFLTYTALFSYPDMFQLPAINRAKLTLKARNHDLSAVKSLHWEALIDLEWFIYLTHLFHHFWWGLIKPKV